MKKKPEITAQTRENLINAFWELYQEKKIEKITIKQLTERAGYNRSTFYEYFVDVYDVLDQLENSLLEYICATAVKNIEKGLNADFTDFAEEVAKLYETKGQYFSVLLSENGDPHFVTKWKKVMRPALYQVFQVSSSDVYVEYIIEFTLSAMIAVIALWFKNNQCNPSEELFQVIYSMLTKGIIPEMEKHSKHWSA